jgi:hypothetical protein
MTIKFVVYDNNKPARFPAHKVDQSWDNCEFDTLLEAVIYARQWLGQWDCLPSVWDGSPVDYSGYGDRIEIQKEEKP